MFTDLLNRGQKWKLFLLCVMNLAGDLLNLELLFSLGELCGRVAGGDTGWSDAFSDRRVMIILAMIFFKGLTEFGTEQSKRIFSVDFTGDLRERLNRTVLEVGPVLRREFHSAEIGSMTFGNVEFMNMFFSDGLPRFFSMSVLWLLLAFFMQEIPYLTLPTLLMPFLLYGVNRLFDSSAERANREEAAATKNYMSCCVDGVLGIKTLKSFDAFLPYRALIQRRAKEMREANLKFLRIGDRNGRATNAVVYLYFLSGVILLMRRGVSFGRATLGFLALLFLCERFEEMTGFVLRRGKAKASYEGLQRLLGKKTSIPHPEGQSADDGEKKDPDEIIFDHVCFEYGDGKSALSDMDFSVKKNRKVRLVGLSGGGKTTLLYLLSGLYRPTSGSIRIFGRKAVRDNDRNIKSLCSAVWQDSYLFADTALENIRMASPTATREEVEAAAKKANIHEFLLSLPDGYDTVIGTGGVELSGGEAQRIAIARAFLRDAPILLLDEVTSKLDRDNVYKVEQSLQELMKGRTVFSVTHDLSRPEEADEIFVIEDGRLKDAGRHEELLLRCSSYVRLLNGGDRDEA